MRHWALFSLCLATLSSSLSCSVNILETFANKNTDEAYYIDAKTLINEGDYDAALEKIALMSATYAARRETVTLKASAYAGKCGLNFITLAEELGATTDRLFPFLLDHFIGGTSAKVDACITAEDLVESIGTVAQRTSDENMFLALISFAKIGNILSLYADSNQNGVPDTVADTGSADFLACTYTPRATRPTTPVASDWYEDDLRQLGTGITIALETIQALTGTVDLGVDAITDIDTACTALGPANFCNDTNPADFDATELRGIRTLVREGSAVGMGVDCAGDVSTCPCL